MSNRINDHLKVSIVNVVATASIKQGINLCALSRHKEIVYSPNVYQGRVAYFKTKGMIGKVSIFSSGKMISIGTKSKLSAINELEIMKEFLIKNGFLKEISLEPTVQNIVISIALGREVNIEDLSKISGALYEPEQFAGAILKLYNPCRATALVFASGKIIVAGIKDEEQIYPLCQELTMILS